MSHRVNVFKEEMDWSAGGRRMGRANVKFSDKVHNQGRAYGPPSQAPSTCTRRNSGGKRRRPTKKTGASSWRSRTWTRRRTWCCPSCPLVKNCAAFVAPFCLKLLGDVVTVIFRFGRDCRNQRESPYAVPVFGAGAPCLLFGAAF